VTTKILIIPKGHFGDMLLTAPVFEALKRDDPKVHITVLAPPQSADFVRTNPFVDEVLVFDRRKEFAGFGGLRRSAALLRSKCFQRVYAFHKSPRTGLLLFLARIPARIVYSGSLLSVLATRRVCKTPGYHEVIRNLELVYADLSCEIKGEIDALKSRSADDSSELFSLRVPEVTESELSLSVREYLARNKPFVVLAPGSAWETKRWSSGGFREVARALVANGYRVLIVGAPGDVEACAEVCSGVELSLDSITNMCAATSLVELIYLVSKAEVVVCNDSLALHLAAATKVPTVAVFCATSPLFGFGPWKNRAIVLEKTDLFCKPCRRHGSRRCPTGTNACMQGVTSESVLVAVERLIGNGSLSTIPVVSSR
jgi:heptosyltransferase-2